MPHLSWSGRIFAAIGLATIYLSLTLFITISQMAKHDNSNTVDTAYERAFNVRIPKTIKSEDRDLHLLGPSSRDLNQYQHNYLSQSRTSSRRMRSKVAPTISWCKTPLRYKEVPGPLVALASFPGSGNTWLRYLLQQATGYLTGSVYKDYALMKNGFPAESVVNGSVLVVKNHEFGHENIAKFDKVVLLVRDPFASFMAEFNRRSGGHLGHASIGQFRRNNGKYWNAFVHSKASEWSKMNLAWFEAFPDDKRLVVSYESLLSSTEDELKKVLKFLDIEVDNEAMKCAISRKEGIFKRNRKALSIEVFNANMTALIEFNKAKTFPLLGLTIPSSQRLVTHKTTNRPTK